MEFNQNSVYHPTQLQRIDEDHFLINMNRTNLNHSHLDIINSWKNWFSILGGSEKGMGISYPRNEAITHETRQSNSNRRRNQEGRETTLSNDSITIEMKTKLCGTKAARTIEVDAKMIEYDDMIRFDLYITNQGLRDHHFKIDENCKIFHSFGNYQCTPLFKVGSPHHVVVEIPKA